MLALTRPERVFISLVLGVPFTRRPHGRLRSLTPRNAEEPELNKRNWMPFVAVGFMLAGACAPETPTGPEVGSEVEGPTSESVVRKARGVRTYEVTITNFTKGQPFTPPLVATHERHVDIFTVGSQASFGAKEIAENGNLGPMLTRLQSDDAFFDVKVVTGAAGPLVAGESVTFTMKAGKRARWISFMSMLICTNDGFVGVDTFRLPWGIGRTREKETRAYETRTEINTESFADIVPPCPVLTGRPSSAPGSGMSDPELAESGVIQMHPGIVGFADLEPSLHGFSPPLSQIRITRTN